MSLPTFTLLLLSLLALSTAQTCPCVCRTGPRAMSATMNECRRPDLMAVCAPSTCVRPNGISGFFCCDPSPSPTPTASPTISMSPSATPSATPATVCPCLCRTGARQMIAAVEECTTEGCAVGSCTREGGAMGTYCCNASPSPSAMATVVPCPCICRPGRNQLPAANRDCMLGATPMRCVVGGCVRENGQLGTSCCDPDAVTVSPTPEMTPSPELSMTPEMTPTPEPEIECPCQCRTGVRAMSTAMSECMNPVYAGCMASACTRGRRSGFQCCN